MEHSATTDAVTAATPFARGAIGSEWTAEHHKVLLLHVLLHVLLHILLHVLLHVLLDVHRRGRRHLRRVGGARGRGC